MEINELYKYTANVCEKIKAQIDKEDVLQETMLVLIENNWYSDKPDKEIKKIILGIVWRVSHNFNKKHRFNFDSTVVTGLTDLTDYYVGGNDNDYISEDDLDHIENQQNIQDKIFKGHLHKLRRFIFKYYFLKNSNHYQKFRVWFLKYCGYSNKYIIKKLGVKNIKVTCTYVDDIIESIISSDYDYKKFCFIRKTKNKRTDQIVVLNENKKIIKEYATQTEVMKKYKLSYGTLKKYVKNSTIYKGYYFTTKEKLQNDKPEFKEVDKLYSNICALDLDYNFVGKYRTLNEAAKATKQKDVNIISVLTKRTKKTGEYIFLYTKDYEAGNFKKDIKKYNLYTNGKLVRKFYKLKDIYDYTGKYPNPHQPSGPYTVEVVY